MTIRRLKTYEVTCDDATSTECWVSIHKQHYDKDELILMLEAKGWRIQPSGHGKRSRYGQWYVQCPACKKVEDARE